MGHRRRASKLAPIDEFRRCLERREGEVRELDHHSIENPSIDIGELAATVDRLITDLAVVDNKARIVAGTKTLHHLLPDLVPPMDRAWTGAFFGWSLLDPQNSQTVIFTEAFTSFAHMARAVRPSRLVGQGWRTSSSKILDNAVIGYCKLYGIGGGAS